MNNDGITSEIEALRATIAELEQYNLADSSAFWNLVLEDQEQTVLLGSISAREAQISALQKRIEELTKRLSQEGGKQSLIRSLFKRI